MLIKGKFQAQLENAMLIILTCHFHCERKTYSKAAQCSALDKSLPIKTQIGFYEVLLVLHNFPNYNMSKNGSILCMSFLMKNTGRRKLAWKCRHTTSKFEFALQISCCKLDMSRKLRHQTHNAQSHVSDSLCVVLK